MDLIDRDNFRRELEAQILRNRCDDFYPVSDEVNKGLINAIMLLDDMPTVKIKNKSIKFRLKRLK